MRRALRRALMNDPLDQWARGAIHAWDFTTDRARWNYGDVGRIMSTPGIIYTRADSQNAYMMSAVGLLTPFSSGQLRCTGKGLLTEAAATNLLLWSRDLSNAAWVKVNTTGALTQVGADGVANSASLVTATAGLGTILQTVVSGSAARATTAYVKRVTGSGTIEFTEDGATYTDITASINANTWTRLTLTGTITNPVVGFRITTSGDAIAVDFAQLESATFPTSPIPTTTASATRAGDVLSVPISGIDYPLTMYCEFERPVSTGINSFYLQVDNATGNDRTFIANTAGDVDLSQMVTGGVTQASLSVTGALALNTIYKEAARFAANSVQLARNGALAAGDVSATVPATPTRLRFGSNSSGTTQGHAYIRRAALWPQAMADAELQYLSRT